MHVMDTDCEKIGGGCLTAESAPELAKPSESPLLVASEVKTPSSQTVNSNKKLDEEVSLVNGTGGGHPCTTTTKTSNIKSSTTPPSINTESVVVEEDDDIDDDQGSDRLQIVQQDGEEDELLEDDDEDIRMEVDEDLTAKGTKDVNDEEELLLEGEDECEELAEEQEVVQPAVLAVEKDEVVAVEDDDEEVAATAAAHTQRDVVEDEELEDEDDEELGTSKVNRNDENINNIISKETKDDHISPSTTVTKEAVPVTVVEPSQSVAVTSEVKDDEIIIVNSSKPEVVKPLSLTVAATSIQNKEITEGSVAIPGSENEVKPSAGGFTVKHIQKEVEKRKAVSNNDKDGEGEVSSGSESDTSRKKIKVEPDLETTPSNDPMPPRLDHPVQVRKPKHLLDDDRERYIQEFILQCSQSVEEMDRAAERLHKEVETLAELARSKEQEWNTILRVRKIREEMLERLLRKRRLAAEEYLERTHLVENSLHNKNMNKYHGNNQLMMVPIVSSSPGGTVMSNRGPPPVRLPLDYGKQQRPILPKPCINVNPNMMDPNCNPREGRNGPIVDVKSIIADYRSRHPESVPRRGRRLRGGLLPEQPPNRMSVNPSLISMANLALGSGASIRTVTDSPYNLSQDHARPSSTDPSRAGPADGGGNMGYKDVLAQFAKLTNQAGIGHGGKGPPNGVPPPPPPPYPEVTLHPVARPGSSPPAPPSSSLLHGILTKTNSAMGSAAAAAAAAAVASSRPPANFSPTLARLLTAPDRPPHPIQPPPHFRPQHPPKMSIADFLSSSKKSRNEITITPVSGNPSAKPKEDVVLLPDDDETEPSDRLVIDESGDNEEVPQCQGCRQKPAQFVCAGCGNQWYCSRECQVTAWEEHSDVCSG